MVRDPHLGTGISKTDIVDWGRLSVAQVRRERPDAVVMFIGANEGFPMTVRRKACSAAGRRGRPSTPTRARRMMNTYRQGGAARVYWLNLPVPRDRDRQKISRSVNAAIAVAAEPYRAQVRVLDMARMFTPGGRYRDAMTVGGRPTLVRQSDGIHLNGAGAGVALAPVLAAMRADYGAKVPG